jgi:hypothetical protein
MTGIVVSTLFQHLVQLPVYLVLLAGILVAASTWRKHPRVSMLAISGIGIIFLTTLLATQLGNSLPIYLHTRGLPARFMVTVLLVFNLTCSIITAAGWALVLWALFSWRKAGSAVS